MKKFAISSLMFLFGATAFCQSHAQGWKQLSSVNGDIPIVNKGTQQTSSLVLDVDKDGNYEFIITERTQAPSVVMYKLINHKWVSYIIDNELVKVEAGGTIRDVDNDGDLDVIFGGDGRSNQVWWWENPYPSYNVAIPWKRHFIKNSGDKKQHDQLFGDFDGDGKGNFKDLVITTGFGNHQSHVADLDGDGDYDILAKPYNWETPRIDIWINNK